MGAGLLETDDRQLLLESLRPPEGYVLDRAVGTTFTLDLLALLTAPTAFTLFELEGEDGRPASDPVALLKAVREYGERITIFCQGGQIAVPPHDQLLYANLEDSVYQVNLKRAGALFHPKVWLLRFTSGNSPVRYRLLCLSRNLTFDRSWDTALRLDGELKKRRNAFASNHPLGDFVEYLASMPLRPRLPRERGELIASMASEVRKVAFDLPEGFSAYRFWPLGLVPYGQRPFDVDARRMLVISPFLGPGGLRELARSGGGHELVSRPESLDALSDRSSLDPYERIWVMDEAAIANDAELVDVSEDSGTLERAGNVLRGLHAKVYAADRGHHASVWVGSANATGAAFGKNVEFLVELEGSKWHCGVDAVLRGNGREGESLEALLKPYNRDAEVPPANEALEAMQAQLEDMRAEFARRPMFVRIDGPDETDLYAAELTTPTSGWPRLPAGVKAFARPVTQSDGQARTALRPSRDHVLARFTGLPVTSLTPFTAFELEGNRKQAQCSIRFVLRLPLQGAPKGRHEDILRALLSNRERIQRYLLLILAEMDRGESLAPDFVAALGQAGSSDGQGQSDHAAPLLEGLLRALESDPKRLTQVSRLIADLSTTEDGLDVLPEGFLEVWEPIWAARKKAKR
jgi:hypothetical protein